MHHHLRSTLRGVFGSLALPGVAAGALLGSASISAAPPALPETVLSFEASSVPSFVRTSDNAELSVSTDRYIHGQQSLRWRWSGGPAELVIDRPIPIEPGKKRLRGMLSDETFAPYIYSQQPLGGSLRFSFENRQRDEAICEFDFGLDFSGWRTAWVTFARDMQGQPTQDMDRLRIRTPRGVDQGELYLDAIVLSEVVDNRHQYPDRQVPFVNVEWAKGDHWAPKAELLELAPHPDDAAATPELRAALRTIEQRVAEMYVDQDSSTSDQSIADLKAWYDTLNLEEVDGKLRGRHINFWRQLMVYPESMRDTLDQDWVRLREYQEKMLAVARAYHAQNVSDADRRWLVEAFVMLSRHFLDQGWAEGSSVGTVHHLGYSFREIGPAALLMRDVLADAGLLEPMGRAVRWYFNSLGIYQPGLITTNMDYYNTLALGHLVSLLLSPEANMQVALVGQYSQMLGDILDDETPGEENGFKLDGTAFHHNGHYPAYATGAFANGSKVIRALSHTPLEVSAAGRANFKRALMTMRLYSNPDWGIGFAGRHPLPDDGRRSGMDGLAQAFVHTALSGDPATGEKVDREVLAAALRIWPELADAPEVQPLSARVKPESTPQGYWTLNYAAAGIHRHGDKTVTLRGYNDVVWSGEIYTRDNRFGRYQSNGSITILNEGGNQASGLTQDGWDWNRVPGTTGVYLPLETLESPSNGTVMLKSPRTFAGSSQLEHRFGVFAIDLYDQKMPGSEGLAARKSAFSFEDRIVCLGSGITAPNPDAPVQTTLFQTALAEPSTPTWVDRAEPLRELPYQQQVETQRTTVLVDPFGNGFAVAPGQQLGLARDQQQSKSDKTKSDTRGRFATAWIDHGVRPDSGSYEYLIVLGADIQKMQNIQRKIDSEQNEVYEVLHQDISLHAVYDHATTASGLVFFEPRAGFESPRTPVRGADRPVLVLSRPLDDGGLSISVCDPSLNLHDGVSRPVTATILLAGDWELDETQESISAEAHGEQTRLAVVCHQGQPVHVTLRPGAEALTRGE